MDHQINLLLTRWPVDNLCCHLGSRAWGCAGVHAMKSDLFWYDEKFPNLFPSLPHPLKLLKVFNGCSIGGVASSNLTAMAMASGHAHGTSHRINSCASQVPLSNMPTTTSCLNETAPCGHIPFRKIKHRKTLMTHFQDLRHNLCKSWPYVWPYLPAE